MSTPFDRSESNAVDPQDARSFFVPEGDSYDDFAGASVANEQTLTANYQTGQVRQAPSSASAGVASGTLSQRLTTLGIIVIAACLALVGLLMNWVWVGLAGAIVAILVSARVLWVPLRPIVVELVQDSATPAIIASIGGLIALIEIVSLLGWGKRVTGLFREANWDAIGALGDFFGAVGQILIAILALFIAWRQYVISKDLTIQQNIITQQQTIDSYFQGLSELVLDEEGLLEDWPQERAIAEGRTAAILSSVDAGGKAKIIRFLSRARLLTPLKRDRRLGRAILDGKGGYAEDRLYGVRVIDLGVMLAGANLASTDLRWTDLSEANLIRADLSCCDLVKANLSRAILVDANLSKADLKGTRLFYGAAETATPRSRTTAPDYHTGLHTGAVVEDADFTEAIELSAEQRYYCCAWGGNKTRRTIPGGCEGVPNRLGR
jgi:uncharacterized protein YjbI with pentapeptide repeats